MKFNTKENLWVTQAPPTRWDCQDREWQTLLWNRYWVDRYMEWVGPVWAAESKGRGKRQQHQSPSPGQKWQELVDDPDGYAWNKDAGDWEPITRCAEQLVADWNNFDWNAAHSQRVWATRKKAIAQYKRRVFQDDTVPQAGTYRMCL